MAFFYNDVKSKEALRSEIKRCVEIEKKIRAASNFCMDQSYFRFLFQLTGKSKQSGLSKSERGLAKRNATKISWMHRLPNFLIHGSLLRARAPQESYGPVLASALSRKMFVVLWWNKNGDMTPRFYMCFLFVMATQKYIFRRKDLDSRSFIFVRYEWHEFPHLEPQRSTMIKLHFSIFFSKSGNLRCLNWKNIAQTNK